MINGTLLGSATIALLIATPVLARQCAEQIAEFEKSVIATQEGAGPALSPPASTGPSTSAGGAQAVPAATPDTQRASAVLQMLSQAKQLDQQGKEGECMQLVTQVGAMMSGQAAMAGQSQGAQLARPGMMRSETMGHGMVSGMMMGGMRPPGGHGHMMKIVFAIADTNGDGSLSFEEVSAIHKRIFDRVDANKDGKVSVEEVQAFMRE